MQVDDDISGLIGDILRLGKVASVDLVAGTATVTLGDVTTPHLPWVERAGAFRTWSPPSAGEQVIVLSPEGDIAGAFILRGLFSNDFPKLGNSSDHEIEGPDGLRITLTGDGLVITAPGDVDIIGDVTISGDVDVNGTVTASTDVIGGGISLKDHTHGGVQSGGSSTGAPQ